MTAAELRHKLNTEYGIEGEWPEFYEVDAETYGYVCQEVICHNVNVLQELRALEVQFDDGLPFKQIGLSIGVSNGLLFKRVELILKGKS